LNAVTAELQEKRPPTLFVSADSTDK